MTGASGAECKLWQDVCRGTESRGRAEGKLTAGKGAAGIGMKRSLFVSMLCMGLALFSMFFAWRKVDEEKENVVIQEEVLSGNQDAARGVSLHIASHWNRQLLWDTEYTIGSGKGAKSVCSFVPGQVAWEWTLHPCARADFPGGYGSSFGVPAAEEGFPDDPQTPYPEIIRAVTGRTEAGETREETVRMGDYREYYPMSFDIEGISVEYLEDYGRISDYLTELFCIPVAEDRIKITVEKNQTGEIVSCKAEPVWDEESVGIAGASAFGKAGAYYAFCLENTATSRQAHRGENCGLFWLPFEEGEGWIRADLTRMERVCPLPEGAVPAGLLWEEEEKRLYVTVKEENDYTLLVYHLDKGTPVLTQRVALGQEWLFAGEEAAEKGVYLPDIDTELALVTPGLCVMSREDGGMLMTWRDNGFSFVTETDGEWKLWCSGQFPEQPREEYVGTGHGWMRNHLFPMERECLFDGERLVLAAFEDWDSLNVLLAVYDRDGELYSGLYSYAGDSVDSGYFSHGNYKTQVQPQGRSSLAFLEEQALPDVYERGTGEAVKALELRDR